MADDLYFDATANWVSQQTCETEFQDVGDQDNYVKGIAHLNVSASSTVTAGWYFGPHAEPMPLPFVVEEFEVLIQIDGKPAQRLASNTPAAFVDPIHISVADTGTDTAEYETGMDEGVADLDVTGLASIIASNVTDTVAPIDPQATIEHECEGDELPDDSSPGGYGGGIGLVTSDPPTPCHAIVSERAYHTCESGSSAVTVVGTAAGVVAEAAIQCLEEGAPPPQPEGPPLPETDESLSELCAQVQDAYAVFVDDGAAAFVAHLYGQTDCTPFDSEPTKLCALAVALAEETVYIAMNADAYALELACYAAWAGSVPFVNCAGGSLEVDGDELRDFILELVEQLPEV